MSSSGPLEALCVAVADAMATECHVVPGTPIHAACSGGADSVALVAALAGCGARWPLQAVLFVDHGLRDATPDREAAAAAAERAGVPLKTRRIELGGAGNLQQRARRGRYDALEDMAGPEGVIATAHTLPDQAETVLQRLIRGAGLRGLAAIPSRSGRYVRPMLSISRARARDAAAGLAFHDDPSNAARAFQRNRLRHDALPLLMAENPAADRNLASSARQAAGELALLDALLDRLQPEAADLRGLDPGAVEALARWRLRREHRDVRPPGHAALARFVERLVCDGDTSASLGDGLLARGRGGRLGFERDLDRRRVLVAPCPGSYGLARLGLEIQEGSPRHKADSPMERDDSSEQGPDILHDLWIERARVVWPLTLGPSPGQDAPTLTDGAGNVLWSVKQTDTPAGPRPAGSDVLRVRIRTPRAAGSGRTSR